MTAVCWLFVVFFRDDACSRRSPSASASWRGSPGDFRAVLLWRFRFFFLFSAKTAFLFVFLSAVLCLVSGPLWVGWGFPGVSSFSPRPLPPLLCLLHLASSLAPRTVGQLGVVAGNGPDPPPALGLARVALPVSCWESSATRAEPKAGGVIGFTVTPSTLMIATLLPRGGGIPDPTKPGRFVRAGFCWVSFVVLAGHLGVGLRCRL